MNETVAAYLAFWPVLAVIGVANGILRGVTYGQRLDERTAHQLSTASGIMATSVAVWIFSRFCPLPDAGSAALIGGLWLVMTVAFEFLFGRYVAKHDWKRLLADYDLRSGRVWPLFLGWLTVLPWLVHRF